VGNLCSFIGQLGIRQGHVIGLLDFPLNKSDGEFLLGYVRWRMDHPIVK
jgi:hypothetical protein